MMEHLISVEDSRATLEAIRCLSVGHLACLPTDTLYGLHAKADYPRAAERLAAVKGYAAGERAFILLVKDLATIERYAELDGAARGHVERHLGISISFILKALPETPEDWTTEAEDGSRRIAFRTPDTPFLAELLAILSAPLLSTSANLAGERPLERAAEIVKLFGDSLDLVVSDPQLERRVDEEGLIPSTLVDLTTQTPEVVREGKVPFVTAAGAP